MAVQLTKEQAAVVASRGGELLVSAAAGSGKTFVLVQRLLDRVIREKMDVDQFLIITFTKAAASELRGKIRAAIRAELKERPGDAHLRRQVNLLYRAQISTIHAFCTRLLREGAAQLDLDPDFRLGEDSEAGLLRSQTLDRVLENAYAHLDEGHFASLVDTLSAGRDDDRLKTIVLDMHSRIQSHPDPERWLRDQAQAFVLEGVTDAGQTPWGALLLRDAREQVEYWRRQMVRALDLLTGDEVLEQAYSENFCDTLDSMDAFLAATRQGWDAAVGMAQIRFPKLKSARKVEDPARKEQVKGLREQCKKKMHQMAELFSGDSASLLGDLTAVREPVQELFQLVLHFTKAYQREKRRRRMLDFNDLEHLAVQALVGEDGSPTPLAHQWQHRFVEVMVDEYQDTNAVQNVIFNALTNGGKNLFQVGDVKQSIYRFRLADPGIFLEKFNRFPVENQAASGEPRRLVLSRNFRSRPTVLAAVNFVFEQIMTPAFGEIAYTEDQRLFPGATFPEHPDDETELDVVDLSAVETEAEEADLPRDQAEARFVAHRVRQLLEKRFPVTEEGKLRPIRPEDIAILYRSPNKVLRYLTQALDLEQVPWQLAGNEDFFSSTEVRVALAFLQIVDNPREDVPLIAVLRSPIYAFTGDQLAQLRADCPQGDFYTCVCRGAEQGEKACTDFLMELERLRLLAPDLSAAQLLWHIYDRTGLMGLFGAMPGGQRRQENLLAFYDYTCACQRSGRSSLFDFVRDLRRVLEQGETLPGLPGRQGSGVHILSIHKSKGLEFPVVVLAGLSRKCNKADEQAPMLFHQSLGVGPKGLDPVLRVEFPTLARQAVKLQLDREMKAEELRLLYVAMTRAKDKLIMILCLSNAERTLTGLREYAGPHPDPRSLLQRDSVGEWLLLPVLARSDATALWPEGSPEELIVPLDHWKIRCCRPSREELEGTSKRAVLPTQEAEEQPAVDLSWLTWRDPNRVLAELPSKVTATQMKGRLLDAEVAEKTDTPLLTEEAFQRPRFEQQERGLTTAQRGSAMHSVMQLIDLGQTENETSVAREVERLVHGGWLTAEQGAAVNPKQIAAFWASDVGKAARSALQLYREFKFSVLMPAERYQSDVPPGETMLLQGVIDCCFATEDGLTVVDFKTDRVGPTQLAERAESYRGQITLYSQALKEMTGKPVVQKLLWFFAANQGISL